jgi:hypothetical protein
MMKTITIDGTGHESSFGERTSYFAGEYVVTVEHGGNRVSQETFTEKDRANDRGDNAFDEVFGSICEFIKSCFHQVVTDDDDFYDAVNDFIDENDIRFAVCYNKQTLKLAVPDETEELVFDREDTRLEDYIRVENHSPSLRLCELIRKYMDPTHVDDAIELLKLACPTHDLGLVGKPKTWDIN